VEDVDISKVLTARSVMKRSEAAFLKTDGPRAALRKMKKDSISSLFVLGEHHKVAGIVTAKECKELAESGDRDLSAILHEDVETVHHETPAADLFGMLHRSSHPLAVVDDEDRFMGVVVIGALLAAVAERKSHAQEVVEEERSANASEVSAA
jgi:glycine betaine/proline transport system ATP-binding protein